MADCEFIARGAFAEIQKAFPSLKMTEDKAVPVEISITIPPQEGLRFKVWLALQNNDELHFSVGNFWLEWFPCTEPERVASYVEAVTDFLSGKSRIVEHYRGSRCIRAQLQAPEGNEWKTLGTWSRLHVPLPWKTSFREVRNV